MKRMNFEASKARRREDAQERQKAYDALSIDEKIKRCQGKKQLAKLTASVMRSSLEETLVGKKNKKHK